MRPKLFSTLGKFIASGVVASLMLVIGCTGQVHRRPPGVTRNGPVTAVDKRRQPRDYRQKSVADVDRNPAVESKLEEAWKIWRGTPHRMGGESRKGIDCSGLVQRLYRELFGIRLPRTVALQVKTGRPVRKEQLRPGDLVFFRPPGKRHVGIYMGKGRFLHTSTHRGVIASRLDEGYWKRYYWTSRRHF